MRVAITQSIVLVAVSLILPVCLGSMAHAVLGETIESIDQDQRRLQASLQAQPRSGFTVHVLTASGAVVREYASPSGVVFALAWHHRTGLLNLEALFGPYYQEYAEAVARQPRRPRRFNRITTEHLVVERGGRMGAVSGRVWVTSLLPPDFLKDHIQ